MSFPNSDGGCGDLGCGVGMMNSGFSYEAPVASSCGCGMPHAAPAPNYAPAPHYAPTLPTCSPRLRRTIRPLRSSPAAPGPGIEPVPMPDAVPAIPDANGQNTQYSNPGVPTQNVSMEEFHRLPGTIITGPASAPVAASTGTALRRPGRPGSSSDPDSDSTRCPPGELAADAYLLSLVWLKPGMVLPARLLPFEGDRVGVQPVRG